MRIYVFSGLLIISLVLVSCQSRLQTLSGDYYYETECVGVTGNGLQTLKSRGYGRTEKDAVFNARMRAVEDVVFKGIRGGASTCQVRPLVSNPNLKMERSAYWSRFFGVNGDFLKYVGEPDERFLRQYLGINKRNDDRKAYEVVVDVDLMALRTQLIRDGIIK
jgi:hypothetical protein